MTSDLELSAKLEASRNACVSASEWAALSEQQRMMTEMDASWAIREGDEPDWRQYVRPSRAPKSAATWADVETAYWAAERERKAALVLNTPCAGQPCGWVKGETRHAIWCGTHHSLCIGLWSFLNEVQTDDLIAFDEHRATGAPMPEETVLLQEFGDRLMLAAGGAEPKP